jgi:hypothetical protein
MNMNSRYVFYALALLLCSLVTGCASFPGRELKYNYNLIVPREPKPSIDYDESFYLYTERTDRYFRAKMFHEEVEKVFTNSKVFSKFTPGTGNEPFHLSLAFFLTGEIKASDALTPLLSGITLTVIPGHSSWDYILRVDVKKGDQVLKQYRYENTVSIWIQLFLIVLTPTHFPLSVERAIMDDMLLNFLYDLEKDKLLY